MKEDVKRFNEIDFLKTIAIIGVILLHVNTIGVRGDILTRTWTFSVVIGSMVRYGVPIFFMCTGVLLFNIEKEYSIRKLYRKYIFKFLFILFVWSLIYKLVDSYYIYELTGEIIPLSQQIKEIFLGDTKVHFYFLDMAICVYALSPVVREFIKSQNLQIYTYFMIFWIITSFIMPYLLWFHPFRQHKSHFRLYPWNQVYVSLGYALWGKYLWETRDKHKRYMIPLLIVIGLAGIILGTLIGTARQGEFFVAYWDEANPFLLCYITGVFMLGLQKGDIESRVLKEISNSTLSIYVLHLFFLDFFEYKNWTIHNVGIYLKPFYPFIMTLVIFILSYFLGNLLKKNKFVDRFLL